MIYLSVLTHVHRPSLGPTRQIPADQRRAARANAPPRPADPDPESSAAPSIPPSLMQPPSLPPWPFLRSRPPGPRSPIPYVPAQASVRDLHPLPEKLLRGADTWACDPAGAHASNAEGRKPRGGNVEFRGPAVRWGCTGGPHSVCRRRCPGCAFRCLVSLRVSYTADLWVFLRIALKRMFRPDDF